MPINDIHNLYALSKEEKSLIEKKNLLYKVYPFYIANYLDFYKLHVMNEYLALKREFPNIDFSVELRVKSEYSYKEKVDRKLSEGNTGRIYDIFGSKIIINSVNGQTDENTLIDACYQVKEFFDTKSKDSISIPNKSTDYIAHQKPNGYQAIHLKRYIQIPGDPNGNFLSEVQIKTFRMREHEEFGASSHSNSYKSRTPLLNAIHNREQAQYYLPHYLVLIHNTKNHYLTVMEKPFEERFKYFFKIDFEDFINNQKQVAK